MTAIAIARTANVRLRAIAIKFITFISQECLLMGSGAICKFFRFMGAPKSLKNRIKHMVFNSAPERGRKLLHMSLIADHKFLYIAQSLHVPECLGMISVLVADSEPLLAESLRIALSYESGLSIHDQTPETGLQAVQDVLRISPDVAVLDYWMRGMEGSAAVRFVRARHPDQRIVLTGWFCGPAEVQEAHNAGADAFLSKDVEVSHLAEAVRRVHHGGRMLVLEEVDEDVPTKGGRTEEIWGRLVSLTVREIDILGSFARFGRLEDVAEQLSIKAGTARIHINHILTKTGARSHVEAIVLARQYGLI